MDLHMDSSTLLREIYDSAIDFAIFTMDNDGNVTTWNAGAERILRFSAEEIIGKGSDIIFTPEDRTRNEARNEMITASTTGRAAEYRWHSRKEGSRFWADGVLTPIRNEQGVQIGYLKIMRDITNRKIADAEIHRLKSIDVLTGLANRSSFDGRLNEMMALSAQSGQLLILQLLDLDRFKQVNESIGYREGDRFLQQLAQRMRDVIGDGGFIARLGADEFAVLQLNAPTPQAGGELAMKLIDSVSQPIAIDGHEVLIGASVGIAICPDDATEPDLLLKKADLALHRSKSRGGSQFHYFTKELDAAAHQRSRDVAALRHSVGAKDFWLEFQPQIDCITGQATSVEALLRFSNRALSGYSVEYVISLAIETGLMPSIGLWVLQTACQQLRNWKDLGLTDLKMCINLCSHELMSPKTISDVKRTLAESRLHPGNLEIEITERQAIDIGKHGINTLHALRSHGVLLALDDFGTGYSALSYLQDLPVTALKLDRSFLRGIPDDLQSCAIASAVISLARTLGLEVIAEGVEEAAQADFLRAKGCTGLQGFLFSKPLPAEVIITWLEKNTRSAELNVH